MNFTWHVVLTLFRELLPRVVIGVHSSSCPLSRAVKNTKSFVMYKPCTGESRYYYTLYMDSKLDFTELVTKLLSQRISGERNKVFDRLRGESQ